MKNKIKDILKFISLVVVFVVIGVVVDILVFNFKILTLDNNEKGVLNVDRYADEIIDNNRIISFDLNDIYVNKLVIDYDAKDDVDVVINYNEDNYYNEDKYNTLEDKFDKEVNQMIINCKNNIEEIEFVFDSDADIYINNISINNSFKINYFRIIYLVSFMLFVYIIYKFYKNGGLTDSIHKYFFVVGLLIGTTMIILQPGATFYSWDDQVHFLNTYELIGGNLDWKIGEFSMVDSYAVGRDSIDSLEEQENQKVFLNQDELANYSTYSGHFITYNKFCYIPSAIGFYLCKFLKLPFVICFKMGKFINLFTYLLMMSYAIKIANNGKRILTVIGLIPTSLFLACQYSYDPAVMGGITIGMVYLFNWILDKNSKVDFKSMFIFIFAMLYGCFPKAVYAPLLLMFLFVPKDRFKNKKQEKKLKFGVVVVCLLLLATFILPTVTNDMPSDTRGGDTSVSEQLELIVDNPIGYVNILKDTMIDRFMFNLVGKDTLFFYAYIGRNTDNLYLCFLGFLLYVLFTENIKKSLKLRDKMILFVGIIGVMLLIWTALYLAYTPVGYNVINGVQPRYFIPLLFPLFYIFKTDKIKNNISEKFYNVLVIAVPSILIIISLYQMFVLNYCM